MTHTLFTWGQVPRNEPSFPGFKANRWALQITRYKSSVSIGVQRQIKWADTGWRDCTSGYYMLSLSKDWSWGRKHAHYDGPHDSLDLGWVNLNWSGDWCDRCYEGR